MFLIRTLVFATLILTLSLTLVYASTGNQNNLNYGAQNLSLGGASSFTLSNYFSAAANPATLGAADVVMLGVGSNLFEPKIKSLDYQRESTQSDRGIAGGLDTSKQRIKNALLGFVVPIIPGSVSIGFVGLLPIDSLARMYTITTRESHLLLYNSRDQRPEIYTALGFKLPYNFSLGAGLYYSLKVDGNIQASVLPRDALARMYIDLKPVLTPYLGLLYKYSDFEIGAFYRDEQSAKAGVNIFVNFELNENSSLASVPFTASSSLIAFFEPRIIGIGSGFKFFNSYKLYFGVQEKMWSKYRAPVILLSGKDLDTLTGGEYENNKISLNDSYSFHLGVEWNQPTPRLILNKEYKLLVRAGIQRHTSALPESVNSLNIIDSGKTICSLGMGVLSKFTTMKSQEMKLQFNIGGNVIMLDKKDLQVRRNSYTTERAKIDGHIFTIMGDIGFEY
ncbi:MAG: hypothetical protein HQK49_03715 [Oligoflexia bacterium]|nr:hypothetical protein [Oligoflexia bacterium]